MRARSHLDRRDSLTILSQRWRELENEVRGTKVLEAILFSSSMRYAVESFVGVQPEKPGLQPEFKPKKSPFSSTEPQHLIEHLLMKCKSRPRITEDQVLAVQFGLFYLQSEAVRARSQRNTSRVKEVWIKIQPLLKQAGFLDEFLRDREAVARFRSFIADKMF